LDCFFRAEKAEGRDMIEVYKIVRGMDRECREQLFPLIEGSITRGMVFG